MSDLQPYYAAYLRAHGLSAMPDKQHGYINWISGMHLLFRLESACTRGSDAAHAQFAAWLDARTRPTTGAA